MSSLPFLSQDSDGIGEPLAAHFSSMGSVVVHFKLLGFVVNCGGTRNKDGVVSQDGCSNISQNVCI